MSLTDKARALLGDAKGKAAELAAAHGHKVDDAIDQTSQLIGSKAPDQVYGVVLAAAGTAKEIVHGLAQEGRTGDRSG